MLSYEITGTNVTCAIAAWFFLKIIKNMVYRQKLSGNRNAL